MKGTLMKGFGTVLIVLSIVCFIGSGMFAAQSYDKYANYFNSETFYARNRNAYVGGDAYNYIINGTYFTAFAVYASASALMGLISLVSGGFMVIFGGYLAQKEESAREALPEPCEPARSGVEKRPEADASAVVDEMRALETDSAALDGGMQQPGEDIPAPDGAEARSSADASVPEAEAQPEADALAPEEAEQ